MGEQFVDEILLVAAKRYKEWSEMTKDDDNFARYCDSLCLITMTTKNITDDFLKAVLMVIVTLGKDPDKLFEAGRKFITQSIENSFKNESNQ